MTQAIRSVIAVFGFGLLIVASALGLGNATVAESNSAAPMYSAAAGNEGPDHICKTCGAHHGGVFSPDHCSDCVNKGLTPVKP